MPDTFNGVQAISGVVIGAVLGILTLGLENMLAGAVLGGVICGLLTGFWGDRAWRWISHWW